jgi:hypothetical protein
MKMARAAPSLGLGQYLVYVRILYNTRQVVRVWAIAGSPCPDNELLYFRYPAVRGFDSKETVRLGL